jgi:hypothetical protein
LIDALAMMATDRTRGWWEEYRDSLPASFLDLSELEYHATHRWDSDFLYVPGLLQTEDYARALFSYRVPELAEEEVELRVQHRMRRKVILKHSTPVPYQALIHEAALRIRVVDRAASRAQLAQILELSEANHITVRLIPFDAEGFAGTVSPMAYAGGAVPELDTVVRDAPNGTELVHSQAHLGDFRRLFRKVEAASLRPQESRDHLHRLSKEL